MPTDEAPRPGSDLLNQWDSRHLFYMTARISATTAVGESVGTGFFYTFEHPDGRTCEVLVTNKHVVEGWTSLMLTLHNLRQIDGAEHEVGIAGPHDVTIDRGGPWEWIPHPEADVDLCALRVEPIRDALGARGQKFLSISLSARNVLQQERLDDLMAIEDVLMIGYPIGLWDEIHNLPIVRRGLTAIPSVVDYQGRSEGLVDIAAFPGSSGSPILIVDEGGYRTRRGVVMGGGRLLFLGVLYAGPVWSVEGRIVVRKVPTTRNALTDIPVHLGYYVKAHKLQALADVLFDQESSRQSPQSQGVPTRSTRKSKPTKAKG